jgi:hypothetical protein
VKSVQVDVLLRIPLGDDDFTQIDKPDFWRQGMEMMRTQAETKAATVGGYVPTDRRPEFTEPQISSHAVLGGNWLLWASRWWVEVPDSAQIHAERIE